MWLGAQECCGVGVEDEKGLEQLERELEPGTLMSRVAR